MFMALVLFTALRSSVSILEVPFVAWLGKISYSIYLTHYFIREPFEQVLYFKVPRTGYFQTGIWTGDLLAAFFVLLVLAVSHFTFLYVEDPCRRLARKWAAGLGQTAPIVQQGAEKAI